MIFVLHFFAFHYVNFVKQTQVIRKEVPLSRSHTIVLGWVSEELIAWKKRENLRQSDLSKNTVQWCALLQTTLKVKV